MTELKEGKFTSEFWTKNIIQVVALANMFLRNDMDPNVILAIVGGLEVAYTAGRSIVKAVHQLVGQLKGTDKVEDVVASDR